MNQNVSLFLTIILFIAPGFGKYHGTLMDPEAYRNLILTRHGFVTVTVSLALPIVTSSIIGKELESSIFPLVLLGTFSHARFDRLVQSGEGGAEVSIINRFVDGPEYQLIAAVW